MRTIKVALFILAFTITAAAQTHVAGTVGATNGLGFANPIYGAQAGHDWRGKRFAVSANAEALRIRKTVGGSGYQLSANEAVRVYFSKDVFAQVVSRQWGYNVEQFSKRGVEVGGGIGIERDRAIYSLSYRQQVWETQTPKSPSGQSKTIEASAQFFAPHRIYVAPRVAVTRFRSQGQYLTGVAASISVGVWF